MISFVGGTRCRRRSGKTGIINLELRSLLAREQADGLRTDVGDARQLAQNECGKERQQHDVGQQPEPAQRGVVRFPCRHDGWERRGWLGSVEILQLREVVSHRVGNHLRRGEPIGRVLGVQSRHHLAQPQRQLRIDLPDRSRHLVAYAPENRDSAGAAEGWLARTHRVQHAAQAEQIRPTIEWFALGLLRRHIHRRARHDARLRQAGVVSGPRQTEVGDLDSLDAVFQQDVGRLDVAMNEALPLRRRQPLSDLHTDAQNLR